MIAQAAAVIAIADQFISEIIHSFPEQAALFNSVLHLFIPDKADVGVVAAGYSG